MSTTPAACVKCRNFDQRIRDVVWLLSLAVLPLMSLGMPWVGGRPQGSIDESPSRPRTLWELEPEHESAQLFILVLAVIVVVAASIVAAEEGVEPAVGAAFVSTIIAAIFVLALVAAIRDADSTTGPGLVVTAGASVGVAVRCTVVARRRAATLAARPSRRSTRRERP